MQLKLVENAIDSLNFAKGFYRSYIELGDDKFLTDSIPGYLKMTIISFHNCIELFNKRLIMERNIIDVLDENSRSEYLEKRTEIENNKKAVYEAEALFSSELYSFKTIEYKSSVNYLCEHFDLSKTEEKILFKLSEIRNRLIHFGLNKPIEFFEVIRVINDTIDIIYSYYFDKIVQLDRHVELYHQEDFEKLYELLDEGVWVENETWAVAYADNFVNINYIFDSLLDEKFVRKLDDQGYKIDIEFGEYSNSEHLSINIYNKQGTRIKKLSTRNISRYNATILSEVNENESNEIAILVIDHDKMLLEEAEDCYIYYKFKTELNLEYNCAFWEKDSTRKVGKCVKVKFDKQTLKQQFLKYLKSIVKHELFENKHFE